MDGYDADAESNAAAAGVSDRVTFHRHDLAQPVRDSYDVIFLFECVHDFGYPQKVLTTVRGALADDGTVQRFFANVSPLWCLPQGRDESEMDPAGTVMRPARLKALATASGFGSAEVIGIEHPFFRFYQLKA